MITNKARAAQNSCQERWRDSPSLTRPSCFSRDISKHDLQGRRGSLPRLQPIPNANSCYAKCWRTGMFKKWQSGKTVIHRESLVHYSSDPQTTPHRQLVVKKSFCRIWGSIVDVSFTVSHSGGRERGAGWPTSHSSNAWDVSSTTLHTRNVSPAYAANPADSKESQGIYFFGCCGPAAMNSNPLADTKMGKELFSCVQSVPVPYHKWGKSSACSPRVFQVQNCQSKASFQHPIKWSV